MLKLEITRGLGAGQTVESSADPLRIGRAPDSDLPLTDDLVSSDHARIIRGGERYILQDLRSTNGTAIVRRGTRIVLDETNNREAVLETDDTIELGVGDRAVDLRVSLPPEAEDAQVLAVRPIADIEPTTTTIESDGRLRLLYDAQKRIGAMDELSEVLEAIADSTFDLVPRATHVTLILRDDSNT